MKEKHVKLLSDLNDFRTKELLILNQKAITMWMKQGDAKTKYYHSGIRWRRMKNELKEVEIQWT